MLNSVEIWRDAVGFETYYEVSSLGRVRNARTKKIKSQSVQTTGKYLQVSLWMQNVEKRVLVHRLVAEAFIPNPLNKPQVNHLNKDDKFNDFTNLEWVTCAENHQHAFANGRKGVKSRLGEKSSLVSQYRYVYWDARRNTWKASLKIEGKTYNVGRFTNELSAAVAADLLISERGWNRQKNFN